jgi:hypothetical protein
MSAFGLGPPLNQFGGCSQVVSRVHDREQHAATHRVTCVVRHLARIVSGKAAIWVQWCGAVLQAPVL